MKLLEWWVSDPRPLKTANASAFISSFTNKVLASWFSHSVQWGGKGASLVAQMVKNLLQCKIPGFDPWVRKISRRRKWQPSLVFLPGESHGQWSLAGYSSWVERVRHNLPTKLPPVFLPGENPLDTEAWLATVIGVKKNQIWLSD